MLPLLASYFINLLFSPIWGSEGNVQATVRKAWCFLVAKLAVILFAGPCYIATGGNDGFACVGGLSVGYRNSEFRVPARY